MSIYWFTGQPGAGKTTLAKELVKYLQTTQRGIHHVDGDNLREIFENKDYSISGRKKNIDLAQKISKFLSIKGNDVVVSLVSPFKDQRDQFKKEMMNVIEIYVYTTEQRGRENFHVLDYEPPTENFIKIDTTNKKIEESFIELIKMIDL
jgi:adenylylsulfate kinase-like enzyme